MNPKSYLTFRMRGLPYALDVSCIRELFPMPQIVPVPEAPGDIIGLLNLRGKVIPVMHLGLRLGQSARYCSPRDNVIVIEWQSLRVAVVVNEVCEVSAFAPESIDFDISYGRDRTIQPAFLSGAVKREEELILILNPEGIVRYTDDVTYFASDIVDTTAINPLVQEEMSSETSSLLEAGDFFSLYCPHAT
ncbi:MAG TPA: chemotaxis protein CheW, partial [Stenomitos sp.]